MKHTVVGSCNHIHQYNASDCKGRMFYTTDVHGYFDLLHEEMRRVAFDTSKDILLIGGDNCDRGPYSHTILDYINEPWYRSIQGNHCKMFCDAFESHWHPNNRSVLTLKAHGGEWIWRMNDFEKIMIHEAFSNLPLGMEILMPSGKKIGLVHAQVPYNDWDQFKAITSAELEWDGAATAQWARSWYDRKNKGIVKGIDLVMTGHTPTDSGDPELLGNMMFCDAGSFFREKLNFIEINEDLFK